MSAAREESLPINFPKPAKVWNGRFPATERRISPGFTLGLTLIQEGDRQGGLKEIETGLRGINDFLNNISRTQGFNIGQFWI